MNALPADIRHKAHEVLGELVQGRINSKDIELLLIWLREFSAKDSAFREIAHFIAHAKRDCGNTFLALYSLYCRWRAYSEYQYKKKPLDLSKPLEKWFFDFLMFQLDVVESKKLKLTYGFSRKQAKKIVQDCFSERKGIYTCTKPQSQELAAILKEVFSFIKVSALYDKTEVIESWLNTLESLRLIDSREPWLEHLDKVFLCFLVLMNKRTFHIGKEVFGETILSAPNNGFGQLEPLELRGMIQVPDSPRIVVTLVTTDFLAADWAQPDLLIQRETNIKGHFWTVFDDDPHIQAKETDEGFQLARFPAVA